MSPHSNPPKHARCPASWALRATLFAAASASLALRAPAQSPPQSPPVQPDEQRLVLLSADGALDSTGEGNAFVELSTPRTSYFAQERVTLRVRFGFEAQFLESLLQLFPRQLDVPVQLQAPWLAKLGGAIALESAPEPTKGARERRTLALDDSLGSAARVEDRLEGERRFVVLELERSFRPSAAGRLALPGPVLRFAYATRFDERFLNGRVPADRRDAFVRGEGLELEIAPLPEQGRPLEFGGAVGQFSVRAEASPRALAVGDSLELALRIEGDGNLEGFEAPRLEGLDGFHLLGTSEALDSGSRTIAYQLTPQLESVKRIPPIAFAYFDPTPPASYRTLHTDAIALDVRARAASSSSGPPSSAPAPAPAQAPRRFTALFVAALVSGIVAVIAIALLRRARERRRNERERNHPGRVRVRIAAAAFRARAEDRDAELADPLAEFLAVCLGVPTAGVIGARLAARLETAGVPRALASRAATVFESLVAARYGGAAHAESAADVRSLVDEIEISFRGAR